MIIHNNRPLKPITVKAAKKASTDSSPKKEEKIPFVAPSTKDEPISEEASKDKKSEE